MSENIFKFNFDNETQKRKPIIEDFIKKIIPNEEWPIFISDDATIFDISSDNENTLIQKIMNSYDIKLSKEQLQLKLWQLLDFIYNNFYQNP